MGLVLLTGGARSGKSRLAVDLAARQRGPTVFIATAETLDDEMVERVRRHRDMRPSTWTTIEEPVDLEGAIAGTAAGAFLIVDCLSLWVANLMMRELPDDDILERSRRAASLAANRTGGSVAVTNEVGSGVHPEHQLGRRYRDVLGLVNGDWATEATRVGLVLAGRLLPLSAAEDVWKDEGWMTN
ncbi:MAG: bifunctional adenosylcobinamide kinase/adenosylcobinamide-phosphate guanylyltransferase [Acidimicrobiia bacterium]|nr:bifunctional adenosylcobinamide kinase/adenosylcobinamide-phosphate guanylyltransferase [Acidimicrobiia bacterium]